jgi:hypothetical protein
MGRTKESYEADAIAAFQRNLLEKYAGRCCSTGEKLAEAIGVNKDTARKYKADPMTMRVETLAILVKTFKPDPFLLLEAVGYSKAEITKRCKQHLV